MTFPNPRKPFVLLKQMEARIYHTTNVPYMVLHTSSERLLKFGNTRLMNLRLTWGVD